MRNAVKRSVVWSNAFYLIPFVAAIYYHLDVAAWAIGTLLVFSFAFHASRERKFAVADFFAAGVVVLFCAALLSVGGFNSPFLLIAALLVIAALYIRYQLEGGKRNDQPHALWHLIAATTILTCILSFVNA